MFKKIGIITQARMTSTRLPGKVLKKINDKTLLDYHIERLRMAEVDLFIATTINRTDDPLVDFAKEKNIAFYRGSETDVLSRFYECAKKNHLDIIVRVTSDCPLIDGNLIKKGIEAYLADSSERKYVSNCIKRTFARGFDFEIFSFAMLEKAYHEAVEGAEREHVTPFIRNKIIDIKKIDILNSADHSNLRVTVDESDDFKLIEKLIIDFSADKMEFRNIEQILIDNKNLLSINSHVEQKKLN